MVHNILVASGTWFENFRDIQHSDSIIVKPKIKCYLLTTQRKILIRTRSAFIIKMCRYIICLCINYKVRCLTKRVRNEIQAEREDKTQKKGREKADRNVTDTALTVGELYITQTSKTGWTLKTKQKLTQHKKNAEHAFFTSSKFPWMIDHVGFTKCVLAILNSTLAHAARYFFFFKWTEYNYSVCLGHVQIYYKTTT